jgi:hypothetical protein
VNTADEAGAGNTNDDGRMTAFRTEEPSQGMPGNRPCRPAVRVSNLARRTNSMIARWACLGASFFGRAARGSVALRKIACGSSEGLTMRPLKAVDPRAHVGRSTRTGGDVSCKCRSASITR